MKIAKKITCAVGLSSLLLLAACNNQSTTASQSKNTMYMGLVNAPVSFNPINSQDTSAKFLERFMFDSLLDMDAPLHFIPKLADSFETKDKKTYTIHINEKAKWSDGKPVTADDIIYTMDLVANPKTETNIGAYFTIFEGLDSNGKLKSGDTSIPSVKKVDDKTVSFQTKVPVDPNLVKEQIGTNLLVLPKHVLEKVSPEKLSENAYMMHPTVTNGAFKFVTYKKNQYVEYAANKDYYRGTPKLDKFFVKIMPASNLVAQLQTGELTMNAANGIGKIPVEDYKTVENFKNVSTKFESNYNYQTMIFNTENIKQAKVRQAISYAIDRQAIVDKLLKGKGEVVDGPYTSISPYLDKNAPTFSYDPAKAKQMLKDAGWDFNKSINLVVPIGNKVREQSADLILANLKAAGLKVNETKFDFPTIMQKAKKGEFDLLLMGLTGYADPDVTTYYSSTGTSNYSKLVNKKNDALIAQGKTEANEKKRKEIYSQLQIIWHQDVPMITLYSDQEMEVVSKDVAYGSPGIFAFSKDLQKWSIKGVN